MLLTMTIDADDERAGAEAAPCADGAGSSDTQPALPARPSVQPEVAPSEIRETARIKAGRELRETLGQVIRLQSRSKVTEAEGLLEGMRSASGPASDALAKKRAGEMRNLTFTFGDLALTEKVISKYLDMPEVKRLLPQHLRASQNEHADLHTAMVLLQAAREFFINVHLQVPGFRWAPQRRRPQRLLGRPRRAHPRGHLREPPRPRSHAHPRSTLPHHQEGGGGAAGGGAEGGMDADDDDEAPRGQGRSQAHRQVVAHGGGEQ